MSLFFTIPTRIYSGMCDGGGNEIPDADADELLRALIMNRVKKWRESPPDANRYRAALALQAAMSEEGVVPPPVTEELDPVNQALLGEDSSTS